MLMKLNIPVDDFRGCVVDIVSLIRNDELFGTFMQNTSIDTIVKLNYDLMRDDQHKILTIKRVDEEHVIPICEQNAGPLFRYDNDFDIYYREALFNGKIITCILKIYEFEISDEVVLDEEILNLDNMVIYL